MERLDKVFQTDLCSLDGWSYRVVSYEDLTVIYVLEEGEEPREVGRLTAGYDKQVAEEIIRLRELKEKEG